MVEGNMSVHTESSWNVCVENCMCLYTASFLQEHVVVEEHFWLVFWGTPVDSNQFNCYKICILFARFHHLTTGYVWLSLQSEQTMLGSVLNLSLSAEWLCLIDSPQAVTSEITHSHGVKDPRQRANRRGRGPLRDESISPRTVLKVKNVVLLSMSMLHTPIMWKNLNTTIHLFD